MCDFHDVKEDKWSGFLHASTVSKTNNGFVIIGESGSGKSTSCAILSKNGYDLIADDSPFYFASPLKNLRPCRDIF